MNAQSVTGDLIQFNYRVEFLSSSEVKFSVTTMFCFVTTAGYLFTFILTTFHTKLFCWGFYINSTKKTRKKLSTSWKAIHCYSLFLTWFHTKLVCWNSHKFPDKPDCKEAFGFAATTSHSTNNNMQTDSWNKSEMKNNESAVIRIYVWHTHNGTTITCKIVKKNLYQVQIRYRFF